MRYLVLFTFSALCLLFACTKDNVQTAAELQNLAVDSRGSEKVTVCHKTGNGSYHAIEISINALPAHLAHGDYLPDADGDGYTATGACTGSMDDCDDNNAEVNPGAAEICGNGIDDNCDGNIDENCCPAYPYFTEESLEGANFVYYYASEINNCLPNPFTYLLFIQTDQYAVGVLDFLGTPAVIYADGANTCFAFVGVDITQEDWEAAQSLIEQTIIENSIPNFCGDCAACLPGSEENAKAKAFLESIKTTVNTKVKTQ